MALDNALAFLRQPGRLAVNPTDISIGQAFPFGGTSLGYTRDGVEVALESRFVPLHAEDVRGPFDFLWMGWDRTPLVLVDLLQWDNDAVSMAFPGSFSTASTTTGNRMVTWPGHPMGTLLSAAVTNVKLLFSPDNVRDGRFALFRSAIPLVAESARLQFKRKDPLVLPLAFRAMLDRAAADAQQCFVVGDVRDVSL